MPLRRLRIPLGRVLGGNASLWTALLPAVAFVAAALQLALSPVDPDYWWHLSTGRWMLDHGRVPFTDPFSFTHGGQNWYAHEWLSELVIGVVDKIAGYAGEIVLTAAIVAAGAWLLGRAARYYGSSGRTALLLIAGSGLFVLGSLAVRPQVWGWALFSLLLHELAAHDVGLRRKLWHLPLIFALWVNIHLTVLLGGFALALYVLHRAARWLTTRGDERACEFERLRYVFSAGVLSALALSFNPRGPALLWFTRVYANPVAVRYRYIGEWQRPSFAGNDRWLFLLAGAVVLLAAAGMIWRRRLWPGIMVLSLAAASLRATRYVPVFAVVSVPAVAWFISGLRSRGRPRHNVQIPAALGVALAIAAVAAIWMGAWVGGPSQFQRVANAAPGGYPVEAAEYVKANLPGARIFNEYGWGGYIIYVFYPERRVYIDGREEMYGERFFDRFVRTIGAQDGWQRTLAEAGVSATIVDPTGPLATAMESDPGWRRVFADQIAAVYVPQ